MVANLEVERWQVLHQQLRTIVQRRAVLDAEEARCLREAYALQLWRQLGYIHMGEYLEWEMGYGPQVGAERLRVARELGALPQMEARLTTGELSYSAVRELTRIATSETEQAWLDEADGKNLRQIEAMVAGRKRGDQPSDPTTPELVNRVVRLELSPAAFATLRQAQAAIADDHGGRLDDSTFIEVLCRRALEGAASADRPAHQISFTVCESCKRGWQNGAGREIDIAPGVIERARCDAEWIGSLEVAQPERVNSTVTPRIRRQVLAHDHQRCTVPGCRSARNLDLHHIEYQRDGGSHEMWNLTVLCSGHHRELHDGTLHIRGTAPDRLTFSRGATTRDATDDVRVDAADGRVGGPPGPAGCERVDGPPGPARHKVRCGYTGAHAPTRVANDGATEARSGLRVRTQGDEGFDSAVREQEARDVLTAAGYSAQIARAAVAAAGPHVGDEPTLEALVRAALQCCPGRARDRARHGPAGDWR
jgi:hypothetical protein